MPADKNDPNAKEKDKAEGQVVNIFTGFFSEQRRRVEKALPLDPRLARAGLDNRFWINEDELLYLLLRQQLQDFADIAALAELERLPAGADLALVYKDTLTWANQYTAALVAGINETTRANIAKAVSEFIVSPADTLGTLVDNIVAATEGLFGNARAARVAVTEITRAFAEGTEIAGDAIRDIGIPLEDIWQTNEDGLVCPICRPRNGNRRGEGWFDNMPAHPECRCWLRHKITASGQFV
jgi:hypothetical protein